MFSNPSYSSFLKNCLSSFSAPSTVLGAGINKERSLYPLGALNPGNHVEGKTIATHLLHPGSAVCYCIETTWKPQLPVEKPGFQRSELIFLLGRV